MKKIILIFIVFLIILFSGLFFYTKYVNTNINIYNTNILINTEYEISYFIKSVENCEVINTKEKIMFDSLGEKEVKLIYKEKYNKYINKLAFWLDNKEKEYSFKVNVIDNENPIINAKDKITINVGEKIDLLKDVKVEDNSKEIIIPEVIGEYDVNKAGTYKLKYKASDSSGNYIEKDFELVVKEKKVANNNNKYYIKINKTQNVIMVYNKDENGNFNNLVKTFVCSAGENTPLGIYKTDLKIEALSLEGGVYGHYTVRFLKSRGIWFHSVPYFSKGKDHWDNLEYEEYNKLGTLASLGCIRLAVIDAKWIYDNIPNGTTVEIYESEELPEGVVKPTPIKIDINSEYKGWDPTDPDPDNPWKK